MFGDRFRSAFSFQTDVVINVVHLVVVLVLFARVRASNRLASASGVYILCRFHARQEFIGRTFRYLRQASVDRGSRFLARHRRALFQACLDDEIIVGFQVTCNERWGDVHVFAGLVNYFQGQVTCFVGHVDSASYVFMACFITGLLTGNARRVCALRESLQSSTITYWCDGFGVRGHLFFCLCVLVGGVL